MLKLLQMRSNPGGGSSIKRKVVALSLFLFFFHPSLHVYLLLTMPINLITLMDNLIRIPSHHDVHQPLLLSDDSFFFSLRPFPVIPQFKNQTLRFFVSGMHAPLSIAANRLLSKSRLL